MTSVYRVEQFDYDEGWEKDDSQIFASRGEAEKFRIYLIEVCALLAKEVRIREIKIKDAFVRTDYESES